MKPREFEPSWAAEIAYKYANAMIAEREKQEADNAEN